MGAITPSTPRSSTCLMRTWSFHGTRTIGTVALPLRAISASFNGCKSPKSPPCSMSMITKSKPACPNASTTDGSVIDSQAPMTVPPSLTFFLNASVRARIRPRLLPSPSPSPSATDLFLPVDFVGVERHVGARCIGNVDHALHRMERRLEEVHVDGVPLHQVLLVRGMDRRLRSRKMDADRRRVAVRDGDQIVDGRVGGDLQRFRQAAAPVDVRLQDIERILLDEALEPPAGIFVLGAGERDVGLCVELDVTVDAIGHERLFQPARVELGDAIGEVDGIGAVHALPRS